MEIVLFGSGNVANNLGYMLYTNGNNVIEVYNKYKTSGIYLSEKLNAKFVNSINDINKNADLYIISVVDDYLEKLVSNLNINSGLVLHTSGSKNMECLNKFKNYGVLYPLQTFSKDTKLNYKEIPFLLEANTSENLNTLKEFTSKFSDNIFEIDSKKRKVVHTAAVFACNFTNYMLTISEDILSKNDISFDILKPLIKETLNKALINKPSESQTGPAKRKDIKVSHDLFQKNRRDRSL